jgi:hypothetical protein
LGPWLRNARTTPVQPPHNPPCEASCRVGNLGILRQPFFRTPCRTDSTAGRDSTTGRAGAEDMLTLSWTMLFEIACKSTHVHSRTIKIYDYSWDGACIIMDDTIRNRLQKYAWPTPGPSGSMIIAQTMLTLSWTMLFEIVCRSTRGPVQD